MADLSLYRPNVGVVLFHPDGRVWLGRRVKTPEPYCWQFPQGGVDPDEVERGDWEAAARWSAGLSARGVQLAPASALTTRAGR